MDRREWIALLGASAIRAMAAQRPGDASSPKGAVVRTLLKDLNPAELASGITLFHEHITTESADGIVIEEMQAARALGITCIVNAKSERPISLDNLKAISTRTNIHIVGCTGLYMEYAYPPDRKSTRLNSSHT